MLSFAVLLFYSSILVPDNFNTIQEAVLNASPGDTIVVSEGAYKENILISKQVSIKSVRGPDYTTVEAAIPGEPVFKVANVDNMEIDGFTATGSALSGIHLHNSNNNKISDNRTVANGSGISLYYSSGNMLTGNSADSNNKYGIYLESSHKNTLDRNTSSSNNDNGIFLSSSDYNSLMDNNINRNAWNGILFWNSRSNTLRDNRILRNAFGIVGIDQNSSNILINNSTWANIYIIMPPILAYIGILLYLIQRRILRAVYRA